MSKYGTWEPVIGLEIHVELNTKSKLFSAAPNRFGDEPNTNITELCTGEPGTLPILNKAAVHKAIQFGCAVGSTISKISTFDRKSYFYPDLPRNFQITQFHEPIIRGGAITAGIDSYVKIFDIHEAHLEDDTGMLKHFSRFTGIDYNRSGVPLLEIVSEPCISSPKEASTYAMMIRSIMQHIDASDCNMEEGSMRFDANISVRPKGSKELRTKIEIKNMTSFNNMEMALDLEIQRQIKEYEEHDDDLSIIQQSTYRWDSEKREPVLMRLKENAADYRYFPEPDLLPIVLTDEYIEKVRQSLPELPYDRMKRYVEILKIPQNNATFLISNKKLADYFDSGLKLCNNAKSLCNWIIVEFAGRIKNTGKNLTDIGISSDHIATLVNLIDKKTITGKIAKVVADDMIASPGKSPEDIIAENSDYQPIHDRDKIETLVDNVLAKNSQSVKDYKAGNKRAFGFLVGQVMKISGGSACAQTVNELLRKKIN